MRQLTINASRREAEGSGASGRLRAAGKVPAVVYGKGKDPHNLSIEATELRVVLNEIGNNTPLVQLKEGEGQPRISIIKEVQRHPITDKYLHVDFHEVKADEPIDVEVPLHAKGEAYGVRTENGTLEYLVHSIEVRCLPKDAPDSITVDVSQMRVGDLIHVRDLPQIEGVTYLDNAEQGVFAVIK